MEATSPAPQPFSMASPPRKSRFHFHSDTKAPNEFKELEQQSHKRATDFRRRVNQLDHNVATWTSRFAHEVVQREKDSVELYDDFVTVPLERSAERFMRLMDAKFSSIQGSLLDRSTPMESDLDTSHNDDTNDEYDTISRDSDDDEGSNDGTQSAATATNACTDDQTHQPNFQSVSRQVSDLSNKMMRYKHVMIPSLRDQYLDSFHRKLKSDVPPRLHMEKTKAAKREQAIFNKFESMAGLSSRSLVEENAQRIASLKILENKILEAGTWDERRNCRFLDEVQEIRKMLEEERAGRVASDEKVLEKVLENRVMLQKTLLDAMTE